jgi:hypothetical protein
MSLLTLFTSHSVSPVISIGKNVNIAIPPYYYTVPFFFGIAGAGWVKQERNNTVPTPVL